MKRLLTETIRSRIGETVTYHAPDEIGRAAIRYFALAVGAVSPIHTNVEYARQHGFEDVVAPPTMLVETNQYMTGEPDKHGYVGHSWGFEIPNTRTIRGGHEYEFFGPVYPSHLISVCWTITDIYEKQARSGSRMLLVDSKAEYSEDSGSTLAVNRETLIFVEFG